MNSRERVKKVLNFEVPDRVPIDLGATRGTGIVGIAYNKFIEEINYNQELARMTDFITQLISPDMSILEMFHIDVIDAGQGFLKSADDFFIWKLNDNSKVLVPKYYKIEYDKDGTVYVCNKAGLRLAKKPKTSVFFDQCYWIYGNLNSIPEKIRETDLDKYYWAIPWPPWHLDINDNLQFQDYIDGIRGLYETTDYAIVLTVGFSMFETGQFLRGMENFLCDLCLDREGVERLLDKLLESSLKKLEKIIDGVGKYIEMIRFVDDLGSLDAPFISPSMYKTIFKPRHKAMWDLVHKKSNCKVALHSCGSIYELLPDLIEAGLEVLNPVQTTARNMEPEKLKREFGKYLVFYGGCCNTRDILNNGTPKDVEKDVKERIGILGKGGGLIFSQIHNILAEVPPKNIVSMLNAAYKYGNY